MLCYFIERSDCPGRVFAGTSYQTVAMAIREELIDDFESDLPPDELSTLQIVPCEMTQEEIDALPDFGGW